MAEQEQAREEFRPLVPDQSTMRELSFKSIALGTILGLVFGAVTVYLGLKAGLTVTVNIPIAIIAIAVFGLFAKLRMSQKATVLEVNTAQTVGAASESIAAGVIFTIPALFFLGYPIQVLHVFAIALAGGLLGVSFLVLLRPYLVEKEHGVLPYPEGVACAEIIRSGERGGAGARTVFWGLAVAFAYKMLNSTFCFWKEKAQLSPSFYRGGVLVGEVSPEMLGVGYIIGWRTSCIMLAGGLLSWLVLMPVIYYASYTLAGVEAPQLSGSDPMTMYEFCKDVLWRQHIRYIGAGAVAAGGLINLVRAMPTIVSSFRTSLRDLRLTGRGEATAKPRTKRDLPINVVLACFGLALVVTWIVLSVLITHGSWVGNIFSAILIGVFGFFFATVSARLVGEIGVSSNPTSGMTIATLMATCLIFLAIGWTGGAYSAVALSIGAVVCICASNAGNVGQSLKTGFFLGCTPWKQELGYTVGAVTSIAAVGFTLVTLNASTYEPVRDRVAAQGREVPAELSAIDHHEVDGREYDVYVIRAAEATDDVPAGRYLVDPESRTIEMGLRGGIGDDALPAPQAQIMSTVINGMLNQSLPWGLVLIGILITIVVELCGVRGLPFAVGVYLPLYTPVPIFFGGLVRMLIDRSAAKKGGKKESIAEAESSPGILYASGLVAGGALAGLLGVILIGLFKLSSLEQVGPGALGGLASSDALAAIVFAGLVFLLYRAARSKSAA